jgi:hypothetical protein
MIRPISGLNRKSIQETEETKICWSRVSHRSRSCRWNIARLFLLLTICFTFSFLCSSYDGQWNAHMKDKLEDYLHLHMCSNQISMSTAQHDISSNWITAYKKYQIGAVRTRHSQAKQKKIQSTIGQGISFLVVAFFPRCVDG